MATRFTPPAPDELKTWITTGDGAPHKTHVYPDDAVEPTLKILEYLHRRCEGNLYTLVEHVRRHGFGETDNYFYQLLSGRYFSKTGGSVAKVGQIWRALQVWDRFASRVAATKFIETSVWQRINAYVQVKRTPLTCCKFGAVRGRTGNQKSECFAELARRESPGVITHVEANASGGLNHFIRKVAYLHGAKRSFTLADCHNLLRDKFALEGRTLIVDNAQRLLVHNRKSFRQPAFDWLMEFQEDTKNTTILSWTPEDDVFNSEFQNAYFEQFVGRIGGMREVLEIEDYPTDEDIALIAASESFGLPADDIPKLMPRLRKLVRELGRVRALFNALQMAARQTYAAGEKEFRARHLLSYLGD